MSDTNPEPQKPATPLPLGYERPTSFPSPDPSSAANACLVGSLLAVMLVVLAIIFETPFFLVLLIAALPMVGISGLVALVRWLGHPDRRVGVLLRVVPGFLILVLGTAFWATVPSHSRALSNRMKCASNLRQIGQGIVLYAGENNGAYPPRIEELFLAEHFGAEVFVCPQSSDTPSPGQTPGQQAANLSAGGHLSYVYLGKGLNVATVAPARVIAYEPLSNHNNDGMNILHGNGMNVLYGDGHVVWMNKKAAQKLLDELKAGHNPPRVANP